LGSASTPGPHFRTTPKSRQLKQIKNNLGAALYHEYLRQLLPRLRQEELPDMLELSSEVLQEVIAERVDPADSLLEWWRTWRWRSTGLPPNLPFSFSLGETVRKGSEGPTAQAYRPPEGPCHAPYTGQIHARSGARMPFRTVSERGFSEVRGVKREPSVTRVPRPHAPRRPGNVRAEPPIRRRFL
jgi:hypothetical protein